MSPGSIVFDAGVAASEKEGATYGVTVRPTVVPVTVTPLYVPVGVVAAVVSDIVDVPEPLTSCGGLNDAVVPAGKPEAVS